MWTIVGFHALCSGVRSVLTSGRRRIDRVPVEVEAEMDQQVPKVSAAARFMEQNIRQRHLRDSEVQYWVHSIRERERGLDHVIGS